MSIANQFTSDQNSPNELAPDWPAPWSVFLQSGARNVCGLLHLGL